MEIAAALSELARYRTNEIVVTTMGATREWSRLSNSSYDFHYLPSAMGHAPMIGLGLALAQPSREVIVLNGDGSLLMSLGCLVTISASRARNFTIILIENGMYEVTGGQQTAASTADVNYVDLAFAAGFRNGGRFTELEDWTNALPAVLKTEGPRFIALRVEPVCEDYIPKLNRSFKDRISEFRRALT